jgi:dihydrofolate reductase
LTDGVKPGRLPLTIVVAVADNGVIGRDNDLPWRLRTDLVRFKRLTIGKPLIMGRKNWESIGRPLPGRRTVVMTRDPHVRLEGAEVVHGWDEAVAAAEAAAGAMGAEEIIVAGGAEIFRLALPRVSRVRLTRVHANPDGDVFFPPFDAAGFVETFREEHPAGTDDDHAFTFIDLERRAGPR